MDQAYMLVIDDQAERRKLLVDTLRRIDMDEMCLPTLKVFEQPADAIAFAASHTTKIIFTGVTLPGMDGFTLIKKMREQNKRTNFILLADHPEYVTQALRMKLRLSGIILGTPELDVVGDLLCNLWYPLDASYG